MSLPATTTLATAAAPGNVPDAVAGVDPYLSYGANLMYINPAPSRW